MVPFLLLEGAGYDDGCTQEGMSITGRKIMLQIEEWFRRPQRKADRREKTERPVYAASGPENSPVTAAQPKEEPPRQESLREVFAAGEAAPLQKPFEVPQPEAVMPSSGSVRQETVMPSPGSAGQETVMPSPGPARQEAAPPQPVSEAGQKAVSLPDSVAETDEIDQITEKIGLDVSDMIDLEKEDFLLRQIDEFREKARQLQQLMATRKNEAEKLQSSLSEKEAKASELDDLITVRQGEADRIMGSVSERIDAMSADVRQEMSGLSGSVSREVSGLTQNLTQEINRSAESTRQALESAAQNMIDQNTRSLEGLKEQLEQLGQLDQINELSTEMNSRITTLKTDIADKIHAEDVKCYRNIQASMNEQSKLLSDADEKTRQHIKEQVDNLQERMSAQAKLLKVSLAFTVFNFLGIAGILVCLFLFL